MTSPMTASTSGLLITGIVKITSASIPSKTYAQVNGFNIAIITLTLLLAIIGTGLNFGVMSYYRKTLNSRIVSFIYFVLSLSDFCTGLCAFLHALIFNMLMVLKIDETGHVIWLILIAYFFTVIAFKVSAFVSLLFAVIRTINIISPFKIINKRAVIIATGLCALLWVIVFVVDVVVFVHTNKANIDYNNTAALLDGIMSRFYYPSKSQLIEYLARKYDYDFPGLECIADTLYTIPPVLCAGIAGIATVVQVYFLLASRGFNGENTTSNKNQQERRGASITIILISVAFIVCASLTLYEPKQICFHPSGLKNRRVFYVMGYIPFFVNAALNPLILFIRVKNFRGFLGEKIAGYKPIGFQSLSKINTRTTFIVRRAETTAELQTE